MAACTRPSGSDAKGGFSARCHYLQAAISAHVMGEQLQKALGLLVAMQEVELVPDSTTYNAAISACEKAQQWQQALGLLAMMRAADLVPNAITYNAAISAHAKGEQWQKALGLLAAVQGSELLPMSSRTLLPSGLLELMRDGDLVPDVITYSAAISPCEKSEQ